MSRDEESAHLRLAADHEESGADSDDDFEFAFSVGSPPPGGGDEVFAADEVFADGRMLPVYPVFDRNLLSEADADPAALRSGSASSTSSADSAAIAGASCPWSPRSTSSDPSAARRKSASAGSAEGSRRWKVSDLVGGRRSHSDGKEKLGHVSACQGPKSSGSGSRPKVGPKEMDLVTAHRLFYGKDKKSDKGGSGGGGKKSFLTYRPELVGLFANSRAHHHHPFNF